MDYKYLFDSTDRLCGAHVFCYKRLSVFLRQDDGFTWAQYKAKMLRKCKTLLLPFFIWNILGALSYPSRFIDATLLKIIGIWMSEDGMGKLGRTLGWAIVVLRDLFVVMLFSLHLLDNKANSEFGS